MDQQIVIIRRYGGPGSGHHGHAGRPGMVGGSGAGGGVKSDKEGDCYEAAGKYMMDNPTGVILVHGEVTGQGQIEGIKYGHSWCEKDDMVIDKSNGRNIYISIEQYYYMGKIGKNVHKYNYEQFLKKILKHKTWGPWDLKTESGL